MELSSPAWVCRDWEWNTQPSACGANALTHFATAAGKKEEIMHFHTMINIYIFVDHSFLKKLLYDQRRKEEGFRGNIYLFFYTFGTENNASLGLELILSPFTCLIALQMLHIKFVNFDPVFLEKKQCLCGTDDVRRTTNVKVNHIT